MKGAHYRLWAEQHGAMSRVRAELLGRALPQMFREVYPGQRKRFYGGPGLLFCRIVCDFLGETEPDDDAELRAAKERIDDLVSGRRQVGGKGGELLDIEAGEREAMSHRGKSMHMVEARVWHPASGEFKTIKVQLVIDLDSLASQLGKKAMTNGFDRSVGFYGAVVATIVGCKP